MAEGSDDFSTSFHRQRRDLFAISAALIFAQLAHVEVHRLSFLGTDIEIHNSVLVAQAAWLLWGYWFIRYWQALNDLPPATITSIYYNILPERATAISRRSAVKRTTQESQLKDKTGAWHPLPPQPMTHGGTHIAYSVRWTLRLGDIEGNIFTVPQEYTDTFSGRRLKLLEFRAFLYVIFFKKSFTEYFLPPLFALCPAAIWLARHCP